MAGRTDEMSEITVFTCGVPRDHKCDDAGPEVCGGENPDGTFWQGPTTEENRRKSNWGSVSCSKCGMTAMERGMWSDW